MCNVGRMIPEYMCVYVCVFGGVSVWGSMCVTINIAQFAKLLTTVFDFQISDIS